MDDSFGDLLVVAESINALDGLDKRRKLGEQSVRIFSFDEALLETWTDPMLSLASKERSSYKALAWFIADPFQGKVQQQLVDPILELSSLSIEVVGLPDLAWFGVGAHGAAVTVA